MVSVTYQLIDEVTSHAQSDNLEDARETCAGGTSFPNNLRIHSLLPWIKNAAVHGFNTHFYREYIDIDLMLMCSSRRKLSEQQAY